MMRAQIPKIHSTGPSELQPTSATPVRDLYSILLQPLLEMAADSDWLVASCVGKVFHDLIEIQIPRFIFMGPKGGGDTIRLGLFASFNGDQSEGIEALTEFLQVLETHPEIARGFHIYIYPLCNPAGFAGKTEKNVAQLDLVGEFWRNSERPEVYYLEREMGIHNFQGVISLHTGEGWEQFSAGCHSSILTQEVVQPALEAARKYISGRGSEPLVEGNSIPTGFLTTNSELRFHPFEINLGIPGLLPAPSRNHGTVAALKIILRSYRTLLAMKQNL